MNAKQCDRCGLFYNEMAGMSLRPAYCEKKILAVQTLYANGQVAQTYDLCVDCAIKFWSFLKNKEDNENEGDI